MPQTRHPPCRPCFRHLQSHPRRPGRRPDRWIAARFGGPILVILVILAIGIDPLALADARAQTPGAPAGPAAGGGPAVIVAPVIPQTMATPARFPGQITAPDRVELIPRIDGMLETQAVADGAPVRKGDLLFTLDDAPYRAALDKAQANLTAAEVARDIARAAADRSAELARRNAAPRVKVEEDQASLRQADAKVTLQAADVTIAQQNLDHARIVAPFDGRIGEAKFAPGALVGPSRGALAVLVAENPMRVRFYVPQKALLEARAAAGSGLGQLVVSVRLADGSRYPHPGRILFADVEANARTDSVTLVAEVPNPKGHLLDGQLVTVLVQEADPPKVLAIPQVAVMIDQTGSHVLTVDASGTVRRVEITTGDRADTRVAVTAGLSEGDRVIVAGQQKVRPGMTVTATEAATPSTPQTTGPSAPAVTGSGG